MRSDAKVKIPAPRDKSSSNEHAPSRLNRQQMGCGEKNAHGISAVRVTWLPWGRER